MSRRVAAVATVLSGGLVAAVVAGVPSAGGADGGEPANLDQVKTQVSEYYGDHIGPDGKHHASPNSQWGRDVSSRIDQAKHYITQRLAEGVSRPAIVLDIDDTSELTYDLSANNDFGYDEKAFDRAIERGDFTPITPTRQLANWAHDHDVKVFFITGRDEPLREATARGLDKHGFPHRDGLFLDPVDTAPDYLPCGTECTTVEYKAGTRAHLTAQGNTILASIGDQDSDLEGGYAERGYKLPNPMYYIP